MNNLKCADKIQQEFESRNQDFSDIFTLQNDFKDYEDSFEAFADFGCCGR